MPRTIAIVGGGISGLTAAYELEKARRAGADIDWHLFEATGRLGGILETTRIPAPAGEYILEGGPDGWVSEKPWARDLAIELGLESDLIYSNDAARKTYIEREGQLLAIPDGMRLMVPEDLSTLEDSPLFSASAKAAYAAEPDRAAELKANALPADRDESVAAFVTRHFGEEVTRTLAAPLLSGVFGGDVHNLSVRAVMPQFLALEREYGSLVLGLKAKAKQRGDTPQQPIFTTLRRGMASLVEALVSQLPHERLHLDKRANPHPCANGWLIGTGAAVTPSRSGAAPGRTVEHLLLAASLDATEKMLYDQTAKSLLPAQASSAILAAFTWPAETAAMLAVPPGFGFLVPPTLGPRPSALGPALLAATFVDQKFPHRAPVGARILRAFFGGTSADALAYASDDQIAEAALHQLRKILGAIPPPEHTIIRRWPRSLPQYEPGHLDRIAHLESLVAATSGLHLLGNSFRGVGIPDLIHAARTTARRIVASL